jgi:hypothetical protein
VTEHAATVQRSGDLEVTARCSCGAKLVARASEHVDRFAAFAFTAVCPATRLAFERLRPRARAS